MLFFVGALFSNYEGIHKLIHPEEIRSAIWIFVVLVSSIIIEAKSFHVAFSEFRKTTSLPFFSAIKNSTQVSLIVIVLEDSAALIGLFIVLISTTLAVLVNPVFDAIGSIFVGVLLLYVSIVLMSRIRKFIVGESLPRDKRALVRRIIKEFNDVDHVNHVKSIVMGNNKYLLLVSVDFNDEVKSSHAEDIIELIKVKISKELPEIGPIYIELKDLERNQKI